MALRWFRNKKRSRGRNSINDFILNDKLWSNSLRRELRLRQINDFGYQISPSLFQQSTLTQLKGRNLKQIKAFQFRVRLVVKAFSGQQIYFDSINLTHDLDSISWPLSAAIPFSRRIDLVAYKFPIISFSSTAELPNSSKTRIKNYLVNVWQTGIKFLVKWKVSLLIVIGIKLFAHSTWGYS